MIFIKELIITLIGCASLVLCVWIWCRQQKDETIKKLARQIIAYNAEEKIAIAEISKLSGDSRTKTIMSNLREQAEKQCGERPTYTETMVSKCL